MTQGIHIFPSPSPFISDVRSQYVDPFLAAFIPIALGITVVWLIIRGFLQ